MRCYRRRRLTRFLNDFELRGSYGGGRMAIRPYVWNTFCGVIGGCFVDQSYASYPVHHVML